MLRGYRCIIVAAFGWLSLVGANVSDADRDKAERPTGKQVAAKVEPSLPPIIRTISADNPNPNCGPHKYQSNDDLCAQWKAADSAKSAAVATWLLGILGLIVGGATLVAAFMAAKYAKDAATETRAGARAAEKALGFMAETNAADLRPYLFIDRIVWTVSEEGFLKVETVFKNFGKLPARSIAAGALIYYSDDLTKLRSVKKLALTPIPVCAPNAERRIFSDSWLPEPKRSMINDDLAVVVLRVKFHYYGRTIRRFSETADYMITRESFEDKTAYLLTDDSRHGRQRTIEYAQSAMIHDGEDEEEFPF